VFRAGLVLLDLAAAVVVSRFDPGRARDLDSRATSVYVPRMTARIRHLENAPITEALIDFRVAPPIESLPAARAALQARLADRYPVIGEQGLIATTINLGEGRTGRTRTIRGFAFRTPDAVRVAQFRSGGFAFNRLKPSADFDEMRAEALALWGIYVEILNPPSVTRVAVRYINHLSLPPPATDLSRYLDAPPTPPAEIGYATTGFLQRLALRDFSTGTAARVTLASEQSLREGEVTVIFDIDAYRTVEYEPRDDRLPGTLESLREAKNRIFFGSITEDAARLWE
jgi:uncharacterized protein (TIGR04255 family)